VAHVEAGLRTEAISDPFPEEWFRRRIARHADLHFAPSRSAEMNLHAEGVDPSTVHRVGNTGIDSLRALLQERGDRCPAGAGEHVLVTLHRRENWDSRADVVCDALLELASRRIDLRWIIPVHPNPRIANRIRRRLGRHERFELVAPMDYPTFIDAAAGAALIISDSGGIQEESPHLGVPLLVPRSNTERPEGVALGYVRLVPVDRATIVREALALLAAPRVRALPFDDDAPYGAGDAAARIVDVLEATLLQDSRLCA
jgi:UDP-N-acetylglucosamine 2-epimerase (non-hydrolysing)